MCIRDRVYTAFNIPFAVWVSASFFRRIPRDLIEASRIEGASWFDIFLKIAVPLSKGGIATVAIFVFIFIEIFNKRLRKVTINDLLFI